MNFAVFVAALGATALELAEAAVVVLVVIGRGHRRPALVGSVTAAVIVVIAAVLFGQRVEGWVSVDQLRQILGGGLLLIGSFWLLQSVVRPDSTSKELDHESETAGRWAQRGPLAAGLISAKAVGVEGTEAALLVIAIGSPHHAIGAAAGGAFLAALLVTVAATRIERRLRSVAGYTLNRVAGTALALVGCYWLIEGSHLSWPYAALCFIPPLTVTSLAWRPKARQHCGPVDEALSG